MKDSIVNTLAVQRVTPTLWGDWILAIAHHQAEVDRNRELMRGRYDSDGRFMDGSKQWCFSNECAFALIRIKQAAGQWKRKGCFITKAAKLIVDAEYIKEAPRV